MPMVIDVVQVMGLDFIVGNANEGLGTVPDVIGLLWVTYRRSVDTSSYVIICTVLGQGTFDLS